jgi:hypothetical protein
MRGRSGTFVSRTWWWLLIHSRLIADWKTGGLGERAKFSAKTRKNFDALVILGCWDLWKNRNAWVFNNQNLQFTPVQIDSRVRDEFSAWTLGRRGVSGVFDPF